MSAIGLVVVQDGEIRRELYTLVDPETWFDPFNVRLTGISAQSVQGKPTFPLVWELIAPWMDSGVLVAHNPAEHAVRRAADPAGPSQRIERRHGLREASDALSALRLFAALPPHL